METVEFQVLRDDKQVVTGFSLKGVGKFEDEVFCVSFLTAQQKGKGRIEFKDGNIVFTHGGVSLAEADPQFDVFGMHQGGVFSHPITPEDAETLLALLSRTGAYAGATIRARPEFAFGKGFTVYAEM